MCIIFHSVLVAFITREVTVNGERVLVPHIYVAQRNEGVSYVSQNVSGSIVRLT